MQTRKLTNSEYQTMLHDILAHGVRMLDSYEHQHCKYKIRDDSIIDMTHNVTYIHNGHSNGG